MSLFSTSEVQQKGSSSENACKSEGVRDRVVAGVDPHSPKELKSERRFLNGALLGIGVNKAVPGDDVPMRHFVEQKVGLAEVSAFGIEVDEAVGEEGVGMKAGLENVGVQSLAFVEALLCCVLYQEIEACAGMGGRGHQVIFIRTHGWFT